MSMITATQLRTKTKDLVEAMLNGEEVSVIHRSKIIGVFKPEKQGPVVFDSKRFTEIVERMNVPKLSQKEREKRYRSAMTAKNGA